jgi:hypothetical protein
VEDWVGDGSDAEDWVDEDSDVTVGADSVEFVDGGEVSVVEGSAV